MEFLKENKTTLIICSVILILGLALAYLLNNTSLFNNGARGDDQYLKNYKINELVPINISEEQMARKYLAEYTKLISLDREKAYSLVNPEYREIRFKDYKDFDTHFSNLITDSFFDANVTKLNVTSKDTYKQYYVVDSNDNTFIFREYSIMNYDVIFDLITI